MKAISSRRAKASAITTKVKRKVAERDSVDGWPCCILCGSNQALPEAHYIPRSEGGLGIEQNIMTLCRACHKAFDSGGRRGELGERAREYLKQHYEDWKEEDLKWKSDL